MVKLLPKRLLIAVMCTTGAGEIKIHKSEDWDVSARHLPIEELKRPSMGATEAKA